MADSYQLGDATWNTVDRPETESVEIHVLVRAAEDVRTQVSVTRIAPGGSYDLHVDSYSQVFCVLDGRGEGEVAGERTLLEPGVVLRTDAGEPHGLWAAADQPLVVLTANTYPEG